MPKDGLNIQRIERRGNELRSRIYESQHKSITLTCSLETSHAFLSRTPEVPTYRT